MNTTRVCLSRFAVILVTCLWLCRAGLAADSALSRGEAWEKGIPNMVLRNVHVDEKTLLTAWFNFGSDYLGRSNIYFLGAQSELRATPFKYDAEQCHASDFFDAICEAYDYQWTVDPETYVIWLHPLEVSYDEILSQKIDVPARQLGVPMMSGLMEPIDAALDDFDFYQPFGMSPGSCFDYPVAVPPGSHTVRDVVNYSCRGALGTAFFAWDEPQADGTTYGIQANNLRREIYSVPRPGSLAFWRSEVGSFEGNRPTSEEIRRGLGCADASERWAARVYVRVVDNIATEPRLRGKVENSAEALWAALGVLYVYSYDENLSHSLAVKRIMELATPAFLRECDEQLAISAALELARKCNDTRGLAVLKERGIHPEQIEAIGQEVAYIARRSKEVREAFLDTRPGKGIDTGGWAQENLVFDDEDPRKLQFTVEPASTEPAAADAEVVEPAPSAESDTTMSAPPDADTANKPVQTASPAETSSTKDQNGLKIVIALVVLFLVVAVALRIRRKPDRPAS